MTPDTVDAAVLLGCARLLGAHPALTWHEDPDEPYEAGERFVRLGEPPLTGEGVSLDLYDDQRIDWSSTWLMLQARIRGTADPLNRTVLAAVRDCLSDQRHPVMPPPARVTLIAETSVARLGKPEGVYLWTVNFRALTARASAWAS